MTNNEIADLYEQAKPIPIVTQQLFIKRIKRTLKRDVLNANLINDALYLASHNYRAKYAIRKSYLPGITQSIQEFFEELENSAVVSYSAFRSRCKTLAKKNLLSKDAFYNAATMPISEWQGYVGSGRSKKFTYYGKLYPECYEKEFQSISRFLKVVNCSIPKGLVWDRIKKNWPIDKAISQPVSRNQYEKGSIYCITCIPTSEKYIGLTQRPVKARFYEHINGAGDGTTNIPLAKAIRRYKKENFLVETLESDLEEKVLGDREKYWIQKLGTLTPNGFNLLKGGQLGGNVGKPVEINNYRFESIAQVGRVLSKKTGLPEFIIEKCIRNGESFPASVRVHSDNPDAGSQLFRIWKSLINGIDKGKRKGEIDLEWRDYDKFKSDVLPNYNREVKLDPASKLVRLVKTKPWGSSNFEWVSSQECVARTHGTACVVFGKEYNSMESVADYFDIACSTMKYRLAKGMSIEEVVTKPIRGKQ